MLTWVCEWLAMYRNQVQLLVIKNKFVIMDMKGKLQIILLNLGILMYYCMLQLGLGEY